MNPASAEHQSGTLSGSDSRVGRTFRDRPLVVEHGSAPPPRGFVRPSGQGERRFSTLTTEEWERL